MKDKLKAYYEKAKTDKFTQGILVGGVIGISATMASAFALRVNFDNKGVYIPDHLIDQMRETGLPILAKKNGLPAVILHAVTDE